MALSMHGSHCNILTGHSEVTSSSWECDSCALLYRDIQCQLDLLWECIKTFFPIFFFPLLVLLQQCTAAAIWLLPCCRAANVTMHHAHCSYSYTNNTPGSNGQQNNYTVNKSGLLWEHLLFSCVWIASSGSHFHPTGTTGTTTLITVHLLTPFSVSMTGVRYESSNAGHDMENAWIPFLIKATILICFDTIFLCCSKGTGGQRDIVLSEDHI